MISGGKIAGFRRASGAVWLAGLSSAHLQKQVAGGDGIFFATGTLKGGGTSMRVPAPELIKQREQPGLAGTYFCLHNRSHFTYEPRFSREKI
ncbi:hypothetical protein [Kamptonema formosum]|uniref:hypothetical protein n=1 Tax=Kamptonema formosum TaxID=331992 RepID=UPI000344EB58|nr:hypothetical protein [Oscillatoria sp. PCC 10802]